MNTHLKLLAAATLSFSCCAVAFGQREGRGAQRAETSARPARRAAGPTIIRRPDGRQVVGYRLDAPLRENDPDYQAFYRYVPREEFPEARLESCPPRRASGGEFEFLDLDYPAGDEHPTTYRFDMGPPDAPVKEGWTRITPDDEFTWERGYGWSIEKPAGHYAYRGRVPSQKGADYGVVQNQGLRRAFEKRGRPCDVAPLRQTAGPHTLDFYDEVLDDVATDAVLNPDLLAFKVTLPNGRYMVSMILGDLQIPRYGMDVFANGSLVASNVYTGLVQFRGYTEPCSPWPVRIRFPVNVVRRNLRVALRANLNNFRERCEVAAATPDYNHSKLAFGRLSPFLGKRMALHGPPTQMAVAGMTIAPYEKPSLELVRQKLFVDDRVTDEVARKAVDRFNAGDVSGAEECFDRIPSNNVMLKTLGYLAIVGLIDTPLAEEERLLNKAIDLLGPHCEECPDDVGAEELLQVCRFYKAGVWRKIHASDLNLSVCYPEAACLFNWVAPSDVFYSKALSHYGRCFSAIDAHRWCPTWQMAEEAFVRLETLEPGNRISGYYLYGDISGWDFKDYTAGAEGAPRWAVQLREAYGRIVDQIEWWGLNRQRPDGGLGGGWGDDVEVGLVWESALLVNPDYSPAARQTVRAVAEGVWFGGEVDRDRGFFDGLADVEHTAEWTGDSQAIMVGVEYGNPVYFERNLKTAKLMRDLWMGQTDRGHLHFKSMMLGNRTIAKQRGNGRDAEFDHPLNGRAAFSAYWDWWYCPLDGLDDLFVRWAEAWYEDSCRAENGKPAGIIPGPVGFPSDTLGGNGTDAWRRGAPRAGAYENPTYTEYVLNLFASMHARTGDPRWLEPKAVQLDSKGVLEGQFNTVGSIVADVEIADKYAALDAIPNRFGEGEGIQSILDGFPARWPASTSEVASTDRIALAGSVEIITFLLGRNFLGGLRFTPVTLTDTSREVIFLPLISRKDHAKVIFFNFNDRPEPVRARLWKLQVGGEYAVDLGIDEDDDDSVDRRTGSFSYHHAHRGDPIEFDLPGRKAVVLEVVETKQGAGVPDRVVDLAMAPEDIAYADGALKITVHNIGNKDCGPFELNLWHGEAQEGKLIESFKIDRLEAPNDLEPRTVTLSLPWRLPPDATLDSPAKLTAELDAEDRHYEITETNNVVSRSFPAKEATYRVPRVWPSLLNRYPRRNLKAYQPFPDDFPRDEVR
ncbi:MAG: hypothetical protein ACYTG0_19715 [Planctomycetota bacterium]|jgi:hypothetical protein